jgi:hypothetical protein
LSQFLAVPEGAANVSFTVLAKEDGLPEDPFAWWQEHAVLPDLGNIPQATLAGELPCLKRLT